jgi:hypothetical protein
MVKSERNIFLLRNRLNSHMSPYFLLQHNEGRAVFLNWRSCSRVALTVWLITCAAKLTFIVSYATWDRWASIHLYKRWTIFCFSHWYTIKICSHLAVTGSWLCMSSGSICTLYLRFRSLVHFRRCGGSYTVTISWFWTLKNDFCLVAPNIFKNLTMLAPISQIMARTCSPAFWHAPRSLFKDLTNRLALVLPRLK